MKNIAHRYFLLQQTWVTFTAGEVNMLRPCPTTNSTWFWRQVCRTSKQKAKFAITWVMLTTVLDSTEMLSGQRLNKSYKTELHIMKMTPLALCRKTCVVFSIHTFIHPSTTPPHRKEPAETRMAFGHLLGEMFQASKDLG